MATAAEKLLPAKIAPKASETSMHARPKKRIAIAPAMLKTGMPPIARSDARLLILGSLPGDTSLAAAQYYAYPRNHFWPILSGIMGRDLVAADYQARIQALKEAGIALWDVAGEAYRAGSLDQQIRHARINDLREFIDGLPDLRAIAFNGQKAASLAEYAFDAISLDVVRLPSSSPAYTLNLEAKRAIWAVVTKYMTLGQGLADPHIV